MRAFNTVNTINAFARRNSEIPREIRKAFKNLKDFNTLKNLTLKSFNNINTLKPRPTN